MTSTNSVLPKIDYGIITIKKEEFDALQSRFGAMELVYGRNRRYFMSVVRTRTGTSRTVAFAQCVNQGPGDAQSVASDLIEDLGPDWILVVGIAGALPSEEYGLGDVLLASRLVDFSVQAATEGQPPELDASGSRAHPAVEELLPIVRGAPKALGPWNTPDTLGRLRPAVTIPEDLADERYYGDDSWRSRVRKALRTRFREDPATHRPKLWIGAVASAGTLVKDTRLAAEWRSAARSITHIEMELSGVYQAAWKRLRIVPVLSVRGISDVVGFRREGEWTDYACETAAAFARALIRSDLPIFDDSATESASDIADPSKSSPRKLPGDARAVEITLEVDVNDYLPHLEGRVLGTINPLAEMSDVIVLRRPRVPVTITIAVTDDQIRRLLDAGASGRLTAAGIKSIYMVPPDVRD